MFMPLRAMPAPLEPMISGMSRPPNSPGFFLNSSHIVLPVPTGSLAIRIRPVVVELRFMTYSVGCVMTYGSYGFRPRAKLTRPAVPLTNPPPTWR